MKKTSEEIAHNSKEVLDLIKTSKQGDTIIFDEREQKSSQEIMNEIDKLQPDGIAYYGRKIDEEIIKLQAQRQERLECYKKELEEREERTYGCDKFLEENDACCGDISFANKILLCKSCQVNYDKDMKRISFLKQEIKILEGEK